MMNKAYYLIRRISQGFTNIICIGLLICVIALCVEIVMRKLWSVSLSGVHEYTQYFLAILCSFGLSQALLNQSHIRIDIVYRQSSTSMRMALDILALVSMASIALLLTYFAYPVLAKSITNKALANTPLATPLWIPQGIWFISLVWFALVSLFLPCYASYLWYSKQRNTFQEVAALHDETQEVPPC